MNPGILLASALGLLLQPAQSISPVPTGPLRNTFVVASQTVIDTAGAVDLKAEDAAFNGQLQQLKTAKDNLNAMASDSREKDIAGSANDLVFLISACHIKVKGGTPIDRCNTQLNNARTRIMQAINKHKSGDSWVDGPPS